MSDQPYQSARPDKASPARRAGRDRSNRYAQKLPRDVLSRIVPDLDDDDTDSGDDVDVALVGVEPPGPGGLNQDDMTFLAELWQTLDRAVVGQAGEATVRVIDDLFRRDAGKPAGDPAEYRQSLQRYFGTAVDRRGLPAGPFDTAASWLSTGTWLDPRRHVALAAHPAAGAGPAAGLPQRRSRPRRGDVRAGLCVPGRLWRRHHRTGTSCWALCPRTSGTNPPMSGPARPGSRSACAPGSASWPIPRRARSSGAGWPPNGRPHRRVGNGATTRAGCSSQTAPTRPSPN